MKKYRIAAVSADFALRWLTALPARAAQIIVDGGFEPPNPTNPPMKNYIFRSNITAKTLIALMALITTALLVSVKPAWAASITFTDNFSPPSPQWNNLRGNWTATSGDYFAQVPNNNPQAVTILPFDLTSFTLQVTVNGLGDGGILVRTDSTESQWVLLVLGGEGYGQGLRGGNAGNSIYWADSNNPGAALNEVSGVFTPGNTYTIKVTDVGNTYAAFINGSSTPVTTLTDTVGGSNGQVGLYDNQPNTTTGSGSGTPTTFSNFSLDGTTVPEPATWAAGVGVALLFAFHYRKNKRRANFSESGTGARV